MTIELEVTRNDLQELRFLATLLRSDLKPVGSMERVNERERELRPAVEALEKLVLQIRKQEHRLNPEYPESTRFQWAAQIARNKYLEKQVEELREKLDTFEKNQPFFKELTEDYEKALGPHPKYDNGCWIKRTEELRLERDSLRRQIEELKRDKE